MRPDLVGKTWFIWKIKDLLGGNSQKITERALQTGVTAVFVKVADGVNKFNMRQTLSLAWVDDILAPFVTAMRMGGITVYGWQYIYGVRPAQEALVAVDRVKSLGLDGFVLDPEKEYKTGGNRYAAAREYMAVLRKYLACPIGLCTYRFPKLHPELPWEEFLSASDFVMPQVYWAGSSNPGAQLVRCKSEYEALYATYETGGMPMYPVGAAYQEAGWRPKTNEIMEFSEAAKGLGMQAVSFWEWAAAYRYGLEETVAGLAWPGAVNPPPPPQKTIEQRVEALEVWAKERGYAG